MAGTNPLVLDLVVREDDSSEANSMGFTEDQPVEMTVVVGPLGVAILVRVYDN